MATLSEQQVSDGFHSFLANALAQAKAEKLLDVETLSSAEADLMICGECFPVGHVPPSTANVCFV